MTAAITNIFKKKSGRVEALRHQYIEILSLTRPPQSVFHFHEIANLIQTNLRDTVGHTSQTGDTNDCNEAAEANHTDNRLSFRPTRLEQLPEY